MKKIVLFLMVILLVVFGIAFAEEKNLLVEYSDVSTWHWAYETIQKLSANGIISGYPDGTFKPSNNLTRAEAAKILMTALNPNGVFKINIDVCPDVTSKHWASKYIINGQSYITLYEDGLYRPEQNITRLEFVNAVAKSLEFTNVIVKPTVDSDEVVLKDINGLDEDSIKNIKFLIGLGIINGYEDNTFRPNNNLTRAEACKVLSLAMLYRENGIKEVVSGKEAWTQVDPSSGWNSNMYFDTDGNIKFYIHSSNKPIQIYYNGEYFMTPNNTITTVKKEKLYTPDGKEWNVKWFGIDVVDLVREDDGTQKIVDYYQEKEYTFDSNYVTSEEASKILKELFPYMDYEFTYNGTNVMCYQYTYNNHRDLGYGSCSNSYIDENKQIWVHLGNLQSEIWMEEVNGNTQSRIDWINEGF